MFFAIVVLLIIASFFCIRAADEFLKETADEPISKQDFIKGMLVYIIPAVIYTWMVTSKSGFSMQSLPAYFLFGFLTQLFILDKIKHWLPFCFTTNFILSGIISNGLIHSIDFAVYKMLAVTASFFFLYLFREAANSITKKESFGLGDVYLISGLLSWLAFNEVLYALLLAFFFIFIRVMASKLTQHELRGVPLAPYVCFSVMSLFISIQINLYR